MSGSPARMPRLLLITRNLPPLTGGMERLMSHAVTELAQRFELSVIGPKGCRPALPAGIEVRETWSSSLPGYLCQAWLLALLHAWRTRPDGVLAGSGVTAPIAWIIRQLLRIRYVVFVHGLDIVTTNKVYRRWFLPCIRAAHLVIANSVNTQRLAEQAGVPSSLTTVLPPGVSYPPTATDADFRAQWGLAQRHLLLSVGRIVPRKGLARFIEHALPAVIARHPDACLVIIGEEPSKTTPQGTSEAAAIDRAVRAAGLAASVIRCGRQPDGMVAAAYQAADLFVFPVLDLPGDVEGFGMVALEAAAAGLPTFGFRTGGLEEAVLDGVTGRLVESGRYDLLAESICQALETGSAPYHAGCLRHAEAHNWAHYGDELTMRINQLLGPTSTAHGCTP